VITLHDKLTYITVIIQSSYTFGHLRFQDFPGPSNVKFKDFSQTFNAQRYTHISEEVQWLNSCLLIIRNIYLYVQITGLSRTCANPVIVYSLKVITLHDKLTHITVITLHDKLTYITVVTLHYKLTYITVITLHNKLTYITVITLHYKLTYIAVINLHYKLTYITVITLHNKLTYITVITLHDKLTYIAVITLHDKLTYITVISETWL